MTPSTAAATRAIPVYKAGVGSAVLNAARQVGGSLGVALMGAIMAHSIGGGQLASGGFEPQSFMDGFERALLVAAGIAFVGAFVAASLVRSHHEPARRAVPEVG
jgi:hypothetical protein